MLAWLLDHKAEHGHGRCFLDGIAEVIARQGYTTLSRILEKELPESIKTELPGRHGRTDVEIRFTSGARFVVENKTKSVGHLEQLYGYKESGANPIALGLIEQCFPTSIRKHFPLLTYRDIYNVLPLEPRNSDPWSMLVAQYKLYLQRELDLLDLVLQRGSLDSASDWFSILREDCVDLYRVNDRRLIQYFYLAGFRQYMANVGFLGCREELWEINKDQISGVWLAGPSCSVSYTQPLELLASRHSADFWIHIELHNGLFTHSDQEKAGEIQLRAKVDSGSLSAVRSEVNEVFALGPEEIHTQQRDGRTGKLRYIPILDSDLSFKRLLEKVNAFSSRFLTGICEF